MKRWLQRGWDLACHLFLFSFRACDGSLLRHLDLVTVHVAPCAKCLTSTGENAEAQAQNESAVAENAVAEAGEVEGASAEIM